MGFGLDDLLRRDQGGMLRGLVTSRMQERGLGPEVFAERFDPAIIRALVTRPRSRGN